MLAAKNGTLQSLHGDQNTSTTLNTSESSRAPSVAQHDHSTPVINSAVQTSYSKSSKKMWCDACNTYTQKRARNVEKLYYGMAVKYLEKNPSTSQDTYDSLNQSNKYCKHQMQYINSKNKHRS